MTDFEAGLGDVVEAAMHKIVIDAVRREVQIDAVVSAVARYAREYERARIARYVREFAGAYQSESSRVAGYYADEVLCDMADKIERMKK